MQLLAVPTAARSASTQGHKSNQNNHTHSDRSCGEQIVWKRNLKENLRLLKWYKFYKCQCPPVPHINQWFWIPDLFVNEVIVSGIWNRLETKISQKWSNKPPACWQYYDTVIYLIMSFYSFRSFTLCIVLFFYLFFSVPISWKITKHCENNLKCRCSYRGHQTYGEFYNRVVQKSSVSSPQSLSTQSIS